MPSITGIVRTYNSERVLSKCLESLSFCNTILVVDSYSSDSTLDIAKKHGATIVQNEWPGFKKQFEFGVQYIETDWILSLDSDEICSASLRNAILSKINSASDEVVGFNVQRRSWYFDRFMKHSGWYPDRILRVFRKDKMRIEMTGHEHFIPLGKTENIAEDILHYPYEGFSHHLKKIDLYAQTGADHLKGKKRKGGITRGILHGIMRFIKIYFIKCGMLDGRAGFINAAHGSFYAFLKYVRVEEGSWGAPYDKKR